MNLDQSRSLATSRYPYAPHKGHLVNLTSQRRWQDIHKFQVNLKIFIHRNTTESITAMTKNTGNTCVNIPALTQPTLMHYELCFLHVETTSPYEGHTSRTSLS